MRFFLLFLFSFFLTIIQAQTFVKTIGENTIDDGPTSLIASDEIIYVAGFADDATYIAATSKEGEQLWKVKYDFTDYAEQITDIKIDGNYIVGCGFGHLSGTDKFQEFVFKMDISTQEMDWISRTSLKLKPNNIHVENGEYFVTGDEYAKNKFGIFLQKIDDTNGEVNDLTTWYYSGRESASSSYIHDGKIYLGGRYGLKAKTDKYRGAISVFEANTFEQIWSKYYITPKSKYARNYLNAIEKTADNNILALFSTNNFGIQSQYTSSLALTNENGELIWAKEYQLENYNDIKSRDVAILNDGYLLYGYTKSPSENLFLIKTDNSGDVEWAKTYGEELTDNLNTDQGNLLATDNDYIYFVAQSQNVSEEHDFNSLLFKLNLDGTSDTTDCWGDEIMIKQTEYSLPIEENIALMQYDTTYNVYLKNSVEKENSELSFEDFVCNPIDFEQEIDEFENIAINNITMLLDISQSMNNKNKLPLLKQALGKIVMNIQEIDKISALSYSNDVEVIFEAYGANEKEEITNKIDSLSASGQSDIVGGLKKGFKIIESHFEKEGNNRIILATDGVITNEKREKLAQLLEKSLPENSYFTIFLFSNAPLYLSQMQELAAIVDGQVYVITEENVEEILLQEFRVEKEN